MSKRLTIMLTDAEYEALEARAAAERRTPREMAAYLATRPAGLTFIPDWTYRPQPWINPIYPFTVTSGGTTDAAVSKGTTLWNDSNVTNAAIIPISTLRDGQTG